MARARRVNASRVSLESSGNRLDAADHTVLPSFFIENDSQSHYLLWNIMLPTHRFSAPPPKRLLASSPRGTIVRCTCCDSIEVVFGNAVLHIDDSGLIEVAQAVELLIDSPAPSTAERPYLLWPSADHPGAFGFSASELAEFGILIATALRSIARGSAAPVTRLEIHQPKSKIEHA